MFLQRYDKYLSIILFKLTFFNLVPCFLRILKRQISCNIVSFRLSTEKALALHWKGNAIALERQRLFSGKPNRYKINELWWY